MRRTLAVALFAAGGLGLCLLAQNTPAGGAAKKSSVKATKKAAEAGGAAQANLESSLGLKFEPSRPVRPLSDQEFTLPNGLRVLVSENHEIPLVNLFVFLPAGSSNDPAAKAGLAEITAAVVRMGGTASLTASAMPEKLGGLGATLESAVDDSRALFAMQAPAGMLDSAGPILRDLLTAPRLDPEAVETALGHMHEAIGQRNRNPAAAIGRHFRQQVYGKSSAQGRFPEYDSLDNIARSDIESFHRRFYTPERAVFVVEGDITADSAKAKLGQWFGGWKASPTQPPSAPDVAKAGETSDNTLLFADRDDLRISTFVVGHESGLITDPDVAAMLLICEMLTAGPYARLAEGVRSAGGWRAEWSASWDPGYKVPGLFTVRGTVDAPFTTQAVGLVQEELKKLREGAITDAELEAARTSLLTKLAIRNQSNTDQARDRGQASFHGVSSDVLVRTYQSLATLTRDDVARAAAKHLKTEQVIAVAGNSALFDRQLTNINPKIETVELTVQAARPLKPHTDPASIERGREAIARMQSALGGQAKLAAIRDLSLRQEGTTSVGDRAATVKLWERWIAEETYRQDQDFGAFTQVIFYNGKIAWIGRRGGVGPLPGSAVALIRSELFKLPFRLALSDKQESRQVADLGGNVLQITEGDKQGVRIYLDPETWLPQRLLYRVDVGNGVSIAVEETLTDWKEFDGIKWPTKILIRKNGRRTDEMTVTEVKFNSGLKEGDLEKKP